MKIAVILIVLVVAAIALIVIGSRRATARKKVESDKMVARAEAMLADHRRIQAQRIANLPKPAPQRIASGTPVSYAKGGAVKPAPKPKAKPSSSNDETVGYAYEAPDFGYADYTSYDSGSSYSDSGSSGSSYSSGSSDSGYSSGGSSSSSYDSGSSSSSSSSSDSGSSW